MPSSFIATLSRAQLASLIDLLPQALYVRDARSVLIHVNQSCAEMWGVEANALIGTTGASHFPPDQMDAFLANDRDVFKAGVTQQSIDTFWSFKYHSNRTGRTTKVPIYDAEGAPHFLFCLIEDITHATETERALLASEQSYRTLMEQLPAGVLVQGPHDEILAANDMALNLLGLSLKQLMGKSSMDPYWTVVREDGTPFPAEDRPSMRALATREPVRDVVMGVYHPEMKSFVWLQVQAYPMFLPDSTLSHVVVVLADITTLRQAKEESERQRRILDEKTTHLNALLDNMADGVITINAKGIIESINQAASRLFGYEPQELINANVSVLMPMPHREQHDGYLEHFNRTGEARVIGIPREVHGQRKDGRLFPMSLSVSKVKRGNAVVFVGIVRDITQRLHAEEEIRRLAFYDTLTSLPNRRLLLDRLRQAMLTSTRGHHHGALMFLDLDHFKELNDTLGHDVGDELLKQVAQRIVQCVREGDSVARLGGDEFVILLEELSIEGRDAAAQAEMVASKVLQALSQPYRLHQHDYRCTPSIGIVLFMEDRETMDELLKKADAAMYQAKSSGRNTIRFFDPALQSLAAERAAMERDFRAGLESGQFLLHYQIQVDNQGDTAGAECLVRWNHPTRGMVSPAQFIPLAEETGLIVPLGEQILRQACQQLAAWNRDPATARWTVAVNVSALQMAQDDFVDLVRRTVHETGADPRLLKLELTESMLAHDMEGIIGKMHALRKLQLTFSLDDFGTGFSSLSYLKKLPMDQLKIDQSFVRDLETNANDAVIARTIVNLGHSLGLRVIAEGVETAAQRDFLAGCGCDAFQGYFFGRPQPAEMLTATVVKG